MEDDTFCSVSETWSWMGFLCFPHNPSSLLSAISMWKLWSSCRDPAWLVHGWVTSEQRDPVPMMKRVRPHRKTTLLTCLNNSLWSVNPWLTGCSYEEDYTITLTGGWGDRMISRHKMWWDENILCNSRVSRKAIFLNLGTVDKVGLATSSASGLCAKPS